MAKEQSVDKLVMSLKESAAKRKAMIEYFGFVPSSIIKLARGKLSSQMYIYQHEVPKRSTSKDPAKKKKRDTLRRAGYRDYKTAPSRQGHHSSGGYMVSSIMPAELVEFFIKYYARPGDIYIDPFMGQGIQLQVANLYKMDYIGFDICREFYSYIKSMKSKLTTNGNSLDIHLCDARHMDMIEDSKCGFCFTSPPYWDVEYYGDEKEQLGKRDYPEFLAGMKEVAAELFRVMGEGSTAVINVNDFRKQKVFYPYHSDTITLFQEVGWHMRDMWIIEGLVGGLPKVFGVNSNLGRIAPKVHEYAIVFQK